MDEKKEKKTRPGRNGGTLRVIEKGEARPATDGGGRPPGSVSLKKLIEKILDGEMTVAEAGRYALAAVVAAWAATPLILALAMLARR